jgi:2-succinyl-6-hydroxy-2,4-cyclohexadiene-1-carboxylate synthase
MDRPSLHVERQGSGPPLLLSHGFGGSARNFRPQARAFAERVTTTLYDTRGHARSPRPHELEAYTTSALIADFASLTGEAPAALVAGGLSLGAYTALRWALAAPAPPRGLLLAAIPDGGGARRDWALGFADAIEAQGLEAAGERFVWGETSRFDPKGAAFIRQGFLEHDAFAMTAILRQVLAVIPTPEELAASLRSFERPVLIIVGSEDANSLVTSRELAELLPRARLVVIPGAGHVVNLAAPEAFNRELGRFLEELERDQ